MEYETVKLTTKRLTLDKGKTEDFLKVYQYDFKKLKNIDGQCVLVPQDLDKIKSLFAGGMKNYYNKIKKAHMFDWIVYLNDYAIGNILTIDENEEEKLIELEFNLHPSYWGSGYMPEAVCEVIEYLFSIGYDNIVCSYLDGDTKSKRVIEKLGFKPYQILQDGYKSEKGNLIDIYKTIITKEDWFSRTSKIKL